MKSVLIIEDNEENMRLIRYAFIREGYNIFTADSGEEGVETALKEKPSLIIMDISLPGIDGIEATKRIKKSKAGKNIPIVAITSRVMMGDKEEILSAGCSAYFEKPVDPLNIVERIEKKLINNKTS